MPVSEYILCHRCTVAIEYCDYSSFAFETELEKRVVNWVESVGMITYMREEDFTSLSCPACGEHDTYVTGHRWYKDN